MNLEFHPATAVDASCIYRQATQLIDAYEDLSSIDYDRVLSWMERKISRNIEHYTCVTLDGEKCGYYCLRDDGELDDLYVLPQYQNRGIGSRILQRCIRQTSNPLYLYVFLSNEGAIRLYRRFGFEMAEPMSPTRCIMRREKVVDT